VTLLSRIQIGQVEAVSDGPYAYPDAPRDEWEEQLVDWTWQVVASDPEELHPDAPRMRSVEVIITHVPSGQTCRLTERVAPRAEPAVARREGGDSLRTP